MSNPTTIKDVAALAGVSISTVSLVMHGSGRVGQETRERVQKAIAELQYRPHPAFAALGRRSLAKKKDREGLPIAWIYDEGEQQTHINPAKDLFESALLKADQLGYRVESFNLRKFPNPDSLTKMLYARGFVGIVIEYFENPKRILALDLNHFAVTCAGTYVAPLPFHTSCANTFANGMLAYKSIWAKGYRRIAIAPQRHPVALEDDYARLGGAIAAHMELTGAYPEIPPNMSGFGSIDSIYEWIRQHKPDALLCFNSGVMWRLRAMGLRIPEDLPAAGFVVPSTDLEFAAGIHLQNHLVAEHAIERVDQIIRLRQMGPALHPISISIPGEWNDGPTLPVKALQG